jgi:hypothetical protein
LALAEDFRQHRSDDVSVKAGQHVLGVEAQEAFLIRT